MTIKILAEEIDPNLKGSLLLLKDKLELRIKALSESYEETMVRKKDLENSLSSLKAEHGRLHDLLNEFSKDE